MPEHEEQPEDLSFEEAMASLDAIVASLEGERLPLEEMVASYERGMKLLRVCRSRVETARQRVELITADLEGRGKATLSEFTAMDAPESSSGAPVSEPPKRQTRKKPAADSAPPEGGDEAGDIRLF
jgi:exodeoxyribonuclease VII small subunit